MREALAAEAFGAHFSGTSGERFVSAAVFFVSSCLVRGVYKWSVLCTLPFRLIECARRRRHRRAEKGSSGVEPHPQGRALVLVGLFSASTPRTAFYPLRQRRKGARPDLPSPVDGTDEASSNQNMTQLGLLGEKTVGEGKASRPSALRGKRRRPRYVYRVWADVLTTMSRCRAQ